MLCAQEVEKNLQEQSSNSTYSPGHEDHERNSRIALVGHSMGCVSAIHEVVNNPCGITALVLVAPAIRPPKKKKRLSSEQAAASASLGASVARFLLIALKTSLQYAAFLCAKTGLWISQPFFALILRWALREKDFWSRSLKKVYYFENSLGEAGLNFYRCVEICTF